MLYSADYNFLFVHVPKTAGSSMDIALRPLCVSPKRTILRSISRRLPIAEDAHHAHFRIHDTASFIREKLTPRIYDQLTSFAIVRSPFDHAVSHYEYMKQYRSAKIAEQFARMSFTDYLEYRAFRRRPFDRLFVRLPDQSHFLCDDTGKVQVGRILKFESLASDFAILAKELSLPNMEIPRINQAKSRKKSAKLSDYYQDYTEDLVRKIYERDFDNFGYSSELLN